MRKKITVFIASLLLVFSSSSIAFANETGDLQNVFSDGGGEMVDSESSQDEMPEVFSDSEIGSTDAGGTQDVEVYSGINTSGMMALSEVLEDINLGPTDSIQILFAKLQLAQAQICGSSAETYMKQIEEIYEEQEKVSKFINEARQLQSDARISGKATEMPYDMVTYMNAKDLSYDTTGNDYLMDADEWEYNIESLEIYQEDLNNKTQTLMVYLQDFISQYNSYLQGASSAVSEASETLTKIANGQSMYGTSEAGLALTGLVLGLVLGCAVTLVVQKLRKKEDAA